MCPLPIPVAIARRISRTVATAPLFGRLIAGAVLIAIAVALCWYVLIRPRQLATAAATARIEAAGSAATAGAATDAIRIGRDHDRAIAHIDSITKEGEHAVTSAPGADAESPEVAHALRAAVCVHAAHRADPACSAVSGDHRGIGDADADAGRDAARQ